MRWYVEYQVAGVEAHHYELSGLSLLTCGTSARTHLRLPGRTKLPELLLQIEAKAGGVGLRRTSPGLPDIEQGGRTFREVFVPWEEDVFVGPVRFCFLKTEGEDGRHVGRSACLGVLLVALMLVAMGGLGRGHGTVARGDDGPDAPSLWSTEVPRCPVGANRDYVEQGVRLRALAEGSVERAPFDRSVGVESVRLLEQAGDCFRSAKAMDPRAGEQQLELERSAERMRVKVEEDYAALRLGLRRAQREGEPRELVRHASRLLAMVGPAQGPEYRRWLAGLKREGEEQLRLRAASQ